jgi:fructose-bisphosphate aldolase, class I
MSESLESITAVLLTGGKGIFAADETVYTLTKRFDTLGIKSTDERRRTYREMLFTAPDAEQFISGVLIHDETIRQKSSGGTPLVEVLSSKGMNPGIKVDTEAMPLAGASGESVTEGLDIADALASPACVKANAHAPGRYAALCQEQHLMPIVGRNRCGCGTYESGARLWMMPAVLG